MTQRQLLRQLAEAGRLRLQDFDNAALAHLLRDELVTVAGQTFDAVTDRVGAGDAFAAGFLHAWLEDGDLQRAQDWGTALAALKCTMWGDVALVGPAEVEELLARPDSRIRR